MSLTSTCVSLNRHQRNHYVWTYYSKCLFANKLMTHYYKVQSIDDISQVRNIFSTIFMRSYYMCHHVYEYCDLTACDMCKNHCQKMRRHISRIISKALRNMSHYERFVCIYTYLKIKVLYQAYSTAHDNLKKITLSMHMPGCDCVNCRYSFFKKSFPFCLFKPEMCDMFNMSKKQYIKTIFEYLDSTDTFEFERFLPNLKKLHEGWHSEINSRGLCYEPLKYIRLTNFTHPDNQAFSCDEDDSSD